MKSKEIFGLILRFVGLIGLLYVCRHVFILLHKTGSWHMGWLFHKWDLGELRQLLLEIVLVAFGVYMLQGAPLLMKFMYPEEKKDASDPNANPNG